MSNEVRSDSLAIKIYYRKCDTNFNCSVSERKGNLNKELMRKILKLAAVYEKQKKDKNFKPYIMTEPKNNSPTPKASN